MKDKKKAVVIVVVIGFAVIAGAYLLLTSGGGDGGNGGGDGSKWDPYQFEEGEHYKYSGFSGVYSNCTFTWDVNSVSGDQVTVELNWTHDGESDSMTISGNRDEIADKVSNEDPMMGVFLSMSVYGTWIQTLFTEAGLSVGNSWSVPVSQGTYTIEILGTETYAGRESYVGEARLNDNLIYKAAIAKDLGFPTYVASYDASGEKNLEITLQEYSS